MSAYHPVKFDLRKSLNSSWLILLGGFLAVYKVVDDWLTKWLSSDLVAIKFQQSSKKLLIRRKEITDKVPTISTSTRRQSYLG